MRGVVSSVTVTLVMCGIVHSVPVAIVMEVVVSVVTVALVLGEYCRCNASPVEVGKVAALLVLVRSAYIGSIITRKKKSNGI
ncbi:hypothetical protein PGB90_000480 [Kerria lacca]